MLGPVDGARVSTRSSPIAFNGYYTSASAAVTVQALNTATNAWDTIGNATSSATISLTTDDDIELYSWNAGNIVLPNVYWTAGNGGHYARVRAQVGSFTLLRMTANLEGCFNGGINIGRLQDESCFSWRNETRVYTNNYSVAPVGCAEASGALTQGHYMLHNIPTCAQDVIYDKMAEHVTRAVIDDHYQIDHHTPENTEAQSTVLHHGEPAEMGGFFGGHLHYIQRYQHKISVHSYSWTPSGHLPAWDSNTTIPVTWRAAVAAPGGAVNNCDSQSAGCNGWRSGSVSDFTPNRPRPAGLAPGAVCSFATAQALHSGTTGWHDGVHLAIGGTFATFDSPAYPLFFLWHNYVTDVWRDWQACP
jgi:hypothetical protein